MDPYELFVRELRYALNHLYEPELLRHSPLHELIAKSDRPQASLAEFLTAAIEALKPPINEAANSPAWHVYELLYYRYVQRASQGDLAKQLACSIRQVRREQAHALSVLAENLARQAGYAHGEWPQWDDERSGAADGADDPLRDEYEVTLASGEGACTDIGAELSAVSDLLEPLLARYEVSLQLPPDSECRLTSMPSVFVRQTLIGLLTHLVPSCADGAVRIGVTQEDGRVYLRIHGAKAGIGHWAQSQQGSLDEARFLLEMNGGKLDIASQGDDLIAVKLTLPAVRAETVLAIDDNRDVLQLFTRYTEGTQFALFPCSDPASALRLAKERKPRIITLDIMMAGIDGWQLMRELRENRATANTPIVVCSVLAQNELAEMLGADDFVCKPVSREAYLAALERQIRQQA
jgi:CheY-like chemotaxis protein